MPQGPHKSPADGGLRSDMGPGVSPQDPTALTTQQLLRENFWLRELLQEQIAGLIVRMEASSGAVKLLQAFADRTPTTMDVQHMVVGLREVTMEKFEGMRIAVDAAFAASKEVIGKSEASFTKQIDSMASQTSTNLKAVDEKIGDMKDRLTIIESRTSISDPSTQITLAKLDEQVSRLTRSTDFTGGKTAGALALWALIVGGLGLVFGAATFIGYMMKFLK